MDLVLETITPDSFYQNLLLGLPRVLRKLKRFGLKKIHLMRFLPAVYQQIYVWEQTNEVSMPEDMRNFYYSSNGFLYQWSCTYGHKRNLTMGKIDINSIEDLEEIIGYKRRSSAGVTLNDSSYSMRLGHCSKVFELCDVTNIAKVCLVYLDKKYVPTIWLCTEDMQFYFLADSFTKYFCMAVCHIGFPNWQMLYTPQGLPKWTATLMRMICPGILCQNRKGKTIELMRSCRIFRAQMNHDVAKINLLNPDVFNHTYKKQVSANCTKKEEKPMLQQRLPIKKKIQKMKLESRKLVSKTVINMKCKKPK